MTEKDCLDYCRSKGWNWKVNNIDLYDILTRVSCWCCRNNNLKNLRNIYRYLPEYWDKYKELQSKMPDYPFRGDKTIFDLEKRFEQELEQEKHLTKKF